MFQWFACNHNYVHASFEFGAWFARYWYYCLSKHFTHIPSDQLPCLKLIIGPIDPTQISYAITIRFMIQSGLSPLLNQRNHTLSFVFFLLENPSKHSHDCSSGITRSAKVSVYQLVKPDYHINECMPSMYPVPRNKVWNFQIVKIHPLHR